MSTLSLTLLIVQTLLFVVWAFLMFRALFGILGRYRRESGRSWIGPIAVFGVYWRYLKDPAYRREKWAILVLLVLIFVLIFLRINLMSAQG